MPSAAPAATGTVWLSSALVVSSGKFLFIASSVKATGEVVKDNVPGKRLGIELRRGSCVCDGCLTAGRVESECMAERTAALPDMKADRIGASSDRATICESDWCDARDSVSAAVIAAALDSRCATVRRFAEFTDNGEEGMVGSGVRRSVGDRTSCFSMLAANCSARAWNAALPRWTLAHDGSPIGGVTARCDDRHTQTNTHHTSQSQSTKQNNTKPRQRECVAMPMAALLGTALNGVAATTTRRHDARSPSH